MFTHAISFHLAPEDAERADRCRGSLVPLGLGVTRFRPHITLAYIGPEVPEEVLAEVAAVGRPASVEVSGLVIVPNSDGCLALAVDGDALREHHRGVQRVLDERGVPSFDYCWPESWFPHVTLAMKCGDADLAAAQRATGGVPASLALGDLMLFRLEPEEERRLRIPHRATSPQRWSSSDRPGPQRPHNAYRDHT